MSFKFKKKNSDQLWDSSLNNWKKKIEYTIHQFISSPEPKAHKVSL